MDLLRHPRLIIFPQLCNGVLECICEESATLSWEQNRPICVAQTLPIALLRLVLYVR